MGFGGASTGSTHGNGAVGDHGGGKSCFVATACYGEHSEITNSLRKWRDVSLVGNDKHKKLFIQLYYSLWGKPGGWLLRKLPFLNPLARKAILLFVRYNGIKINSNDSNE